MKAIELDDLDDFYSEEDWKINKENGKNLTEKRFSDIMVDAMRGSGLFFRKEMSNELQEKYCIEMSCLGDRTKGTGSQYLTPTFVLFVNKKYRYPDQDLQLQYANDNNSSLKDGYQYSDPWGSFNKEIWKTYWFNIRHIDFRLSENYNENIVKDSAWLSKLKSKKIYQYNTINELENVMIKIRNELFNN